MSASSSSSSSSSREVQREREASAEMPILHLPPQLRQRLLFVQEPLAFFEGASPWDPLMIAAKQWMHRKIEEETEQAKKKDGGVLSDLEEAWRKAHTERNEALPSIKTLVELFLCTHGRVPPDFGRRYLTLLEGKADIPALPDQRAARILTAVVVRRRALQKIRSELILDRERLMESAEQSVRFEALIRELRKRWKVTRRSFRENAVSVHLLGIPPDEFLWGLEGGCPHHSWPPPVGGSSAFNPLAVELRLAPAGGGVEGSRCDKTEIRFLESVASLVQRRYRLRVRIRPLKVGGAGGGGVSLQKGRKEDGGKDEKQKKDESRRGKGNHTLVEKIEVKLQEAQRILLDRAAYVVVVGQADSLLRANRKSIDDLVVQEDMKFPPLLPGIRQPEGKRGWDQRGFMTHAGRDPKVVASKKKAFPVVTPSSSLSFESKDGLGGLHCIVGVCPGRVSSKEPSMGVCVETADASSLLLSLFARGGARFAIESPDAVSDSLQDSQIRLGVAGEFKSSQGKSGKERGDTGGLHRISVEIAFEPTVVSNSTRESEEGPRGWEWGEAAEEIWELECAALLNLRARFLEAWRFAAYDAPQQVGEAHPKLWQQAIRQGQREGMALGGQLGVGAVGGLGGRGGVIFESIPGRRLLTDFLGWLGSVILSE
uniref:Uncharacterized protein n=1 Tax=Chromera velia CCMP2878 TaxID=1169474 RepID=A0A0G4IFX0_9ALVE|eukprot:Cvel_14054.t1-p1 / transcript=Cvel_14054.t1 / gene=Cvel_14054 / organism=Chromera_velia_CCMP2878 / gene_product=hypothetical protein / transcript_product=hypothetical protein / location=Cvel_scaffold985:56854-58818(+) / protein_length=655 / sequence_SO=supercontig / SO=protein_coding / is_pseudo=false